MSQNITNKKRTVQFKFNPYTGKYQIPYSMLKHIAFQLPSGLRGSGITLVYAQAADDNTASIGVVSGSVPKTEPADDIGKLNYATNVLRRAFEKQKPENSNKQLLERLSSYDTEKVVKVMHEGFKRNMLVLNRWEENLKKNEEVISSNVATGDYSKPAKSVLANYCSNIKNFLQENLVELCALPQLNKIPDFPGIPRSAVIALTDRKIQIQKGTSLLNFFCSKNKAGITISVKELLDDKIITNLGPKLSALLVEYVKLVRPLVNLEKDKDELDNLMKMKVNFIPPNLKELMKSQVPQISRFVTSKNLISVLIKRINILFRLSTNNNLEDTLLIKSLFGKDYVLEESKPSRILFTEEMEKTTIENVEKMTPLLLKGVTKLVLQLQKNYGKDYLKGNELDGYSSQYSKKATYIAFNEYDPPDEDVSKENFEALKSDQRVKALFLKERKKRIRRRTVGYASSKRTTGFLKTVKKSRLFGSYYDDLKDFIYSFTSTLLQDRAITILLQEMQRIKTGLELDENFDYTPPMVSEEDGEDEETNEFDSLL